MAHGLLPFRTHTVAGTGRRTLPFGYTVVLAAALVVATVYGLAADNAYRVSTGVRETFPAVMRGQDVLTLLSVPALLWTAHRARSGSLSMHLIWLGLLLYYAYSYVIFAFSPFNDAFLAYVAIVAMSGFAFTDGLLRLKMSTIARATALVPRRGPAVFLLLVSVVFGGLWLAMILPAIPGGLPGGRVTYDIASAVHVLDLAFMMPLIVATAWMLLRDHPAGVALGVVLLCKMVTLGAAMLSMNLIFLDSPDLVEVTLWVVVAGVAAGLLARTLRHTTAPGRPWLRERLWC